jgi:glycosyltransferase involved in cell wall biosynthesis
MSDRPTVVIFCKYFLPGYRAGGPICSIANLVARLGDEFVFRVVTLDRDSIRQGCPPYDNVDRNAWNEVGKGFVRYLPPPEVTLGRLRALLREMRPDAFYVNSVLDRKFALGPLLLRRAGQLGRVPVVVAPRGELLPAALGLKRLRKAAFIRAARVAGLFTDVLWQASSEEEAEAVRRAFGSAVRIMTAPPLGAAADPGETPLPDKAPGALRLAFLGRISPIKNVHLALEWAAQLDGDVTFDIHGPVADEAYWQQCRDRIAALPANVTASHHGPLAPVAVTETLRRAHAVLVPSGSENFGHVMLEAFRAGRPVVTSQGTPWRDLAAHDAGWDLPLGEPDRFVATLRELQAMDAGALGRLCRGAAAYAQARTGGEEDLVTNRNLLLTACGRSRP